MRRSNGVTVSKALTITRNAVILSRTISNLLAASGGGKTTVLSPSTVSLIIDVDWSEHKLCYVLSFLVYVYEQVPSLRLLKLNNTLRLNQSEVSNGFLSLLYSLEVCWKLIKSIGLCLLAQLKVLTKWLYSLCETSTLAVVYKRCQTLQH